MSTRRVIFLGGNGHCAARLMPARAVLDRLADSAPDKNFEITEVPYPGFERRPPALNLESFLASIAEYTIQESETRPGPALVYGTGIGGLLALCLRAETRFCDVPLLLQAPVLWGLEHRLIPRLMRRPLGNYLFRNLFSSQLFQSFFTAQYFERAPTRTLRQSFFAGYAQCSSVTDFFTWLNPALLRRLETLFARHPERLENVRVWWGARDRVVSAQELRWTERALGVRWPLQTFADWGHYPMIDEPENWVKALSEAFNE